MMDQDKAFNFLIGLELLQYHAKYGWPLSTYYNELVTIFQEINRKVVS